MPEDLADRLVVYHSSEWMNLVEQGWITLYVQHFSPSLRLAVMRKVQR